MSCQGSRLGRPRKAFRCSLWCLTLQMKYKYLCTLFNLASRCVSRRKSDIKFDYSYVQKINVSDSSVLRENKGLLGRHSA